MSEQLSYSAFESRYQNKTLIGSGGFAKVYKVFDHAKNHYVALKVADVRPEHKKFTLKNEVELVNKLQPHRNIARYDACYRFNTGFTGEMDFALLKFYEYGNLEQFLEREQLDLDDKKLIVQGILSGIEFLHQNNIIHRDMKAQNVLMNREDGVWTPKITDFGLSRQIMEEVAVENTAIGMSYSYAAPEQIQNKKINKNVDLWAVGVVIYRIMANELPFKGKPQGDDRSTQSQLEISKRIINLDLPDKLNEIPEPYQKIIRRCLVLDPLERVQSARELTDLLLGHDSPDINIGLEVNNNLENRSLSEDEESTQLLEPTEEEGEATQVISSVPNTPAKQKSPPDPKEFSPPVENYDLPRENLTQFIRPNEKDEDKASDDAAEEQGSFAPKTGDPKKGFKWIFVWLPLLLLGGAAALWFFVLAPPANPQGRRDANNKAAQAANAENEKSSSAKLVIFEELDKAIEAASSDAASQASLSTSVQNMVNNDSYITDYQPLFMLAKHQAYLELAKEDPAQENYRKAGDTLRKAAEKAIINQSKAELLAQIKAAENGALIHLKQAGGGGYYQQILASLQP